MPIKHSGVDTVDQMKSTVRIGGFSAFWGDSSLGAEQLVASECKIDYMIGDYLAEVTMGILGRGKQRVRSTDALGRPRPVNFCCFCSRVHLS